MTTFVNEEFRSWESERNRLNQNFYQPPADRYFFFSSSSFSSPFIQRYRGGPTLVDQQKREIVTRERILRCFPLFHATGMLRNTGSLAKCGRGRRWSANNHSHSVFPPRISTFPSLSARLSASIYLPIIGVGQRSHMPPLFAILRSFAHTCRGIHRSPLQITNSISNENI